MIKCYNNINFRFDIGSRHHHSYLGVSVQYIEDFQIKIAHIGVIAVQTESDAATGSELRRKIAEMLQTHGLDVQTQIYSSTTDNGGQDMLNAAAAEEEEQVAKDLPRENNEDMEMEQSLITTLEEEDEEDRYSPEACGWLPTRCAAHTILLAVQDALQVHYSNYISINRSRKLIDHVSNEN